jgi:Domain of unknown function (DUF4864)
MKPTVLSLPWSRRLDHGNQRVATARTTAVSRRRQWMLTLLKLTIVTSVFVLPNLTLALSTEDNKAIRGVVEAQLAALAIDDAERAFSFATPSIRQRFGTAEHFFMLVREQYPAVYQPTKTVFHSANEIDSQTFQPVELTDRDGMVWLAVYEMQRQGNGDWRINGCVLLAGDRGTKMI